MKITKIIYNFFQGEDAQAAVEYALVAAILAFACYGALRLFISVWIGKFNLIKNTRTGHSGMLP